MPPNCIAFRHSSYCYLLSYYCAEEKLSTIGQWNLGCRNKESVFDELTLNTRQGGTRVSQMQSEEESSLGKGTACAKALCREESWQRA